MFKKNFLDWLWADPINLDSLNPTTQSLISLWWLVDEQGLSFQEAFWEVGIEEGGVK